MTDDRLQALIRDEVAHQLSGAVRTPAVRSGVPQPAAWDAVEHPSHSRFVLPATGDGACIIEPLVRCTHCGYCKSFGH
jgi:hypothetical protein